MVVLVLVWPYQDGTLRSPNMKGRLVEVVVVVVELLVEEDVVLVVVASTGRRGMAGVYFLPGNAGLT